MRVTIYLEGGGDSAELKNRCREGFRKLFGKCGLPRQPKLVACGSRGSAFKRFCTAHDAGNEVALLLVDSEDPMDDIEKTWSHLKTRDNWDKPSGANDEVVLMMATCMETWIVSDREALKKHYGNDLNENALPSLVDLEQRGRHGIQDALVNATKDCSNKYEKGKRSFQVLAVLTPNTLKSHLPSFVRDLRILQGKLT